MKKGAIISIMSMSIFLAVLLFTFDPIFAAIGPIGFTQETLGQEIDKIRDEAANRQEETSVPVGEDNALPYTTLLLVGVIIAIAAAASFFFSYFFSWAIYSPQYKGEKAEEEKVETSKAA